MHHELQALERRLLGGKMPAGSGGSPHPGVQRFHGVLVWYEVIDVSSGPQLDQSRGVDERSPRVLRLRSGASERLDEETGRSGIARDVLEGGAVGGRTEQKGGDSLRR